MHLRNKHMFVAHLKSKMELLTFSDAAGKPEDLRRFVANSGLDLSCAENLCLLCTVRRKVEFSARAFAQ